MNCRELQKKMLADPGSLSEKEMDHVPECGACYLFYVRCIENPLAEALCRQTLVEVPFPESLRNPVIRRREFTLLPWVAALVALALLFAWPVVPGRDGRRLLESGITAVPAPPVVTTLVNLPDPGMPGGLIEPLEEAGSLSVWQITCWRNPGDPVRALTDFVIDIEIDSL